MSELLMACIDTQQGVLTHENRPRMTSTDAAYKATSLREYRRLAQQRHAVEPLALHALWRDFSSL